MVQGPRRQHPRADPGERDRLRSRDAGAPRRQRPPRGWPRAYRQRVSAGRRCHPYRCGVRPPHAGTRRRRGATSDIAQAHNASWRQERWACLVGEAGEGAIAASQYQWMASALGGLTHLPEPVSPIYRSRVSGLECICRSQCGRHVPGPHKHLPGPHKHLPGPHRTFPADLATD